MVNQRKTTEELIDALAQITKQGFDRVEGRLDKVESDLEIVKSGMEVVTSDLDIVKFNTSGLDRRVSNLEDKMRIVGTKLGLQQ